MLPDYFPQELRAAFHVTGFRSAIAVKRPLMEALFNMVSSARAKAEAIEPTIAALCDNPDTIKTLFNDPDKKELIWTAGAHRSLLTDSAAALMVLVDAEYDRLYYNTNVGLYERGAKTTSVPDVHVSLAVHTCAIHAKHLTEWQVNPTRGESARALLTRLIGDPMRADASAEFLKLNFADYDEFAQAVLTVADGIVTDGTISENGSAGIPAITMRPT